MTSQVLRFGHLSKAENLLDTVLRFFASVDKEVIPTTCLERCFLVHIYLVAVVVYTRCNIISHLIGLNMVVTCLAGGFQP